MNSQLQSSNYLTSANNLQWCTFQAFSVLAGRLSNTQTTLCSAMETSAIISHSLVDLVWGVTEIFPMRSIIRRAQLKAISRYLDNNQDTQWKSPLIWALTPMSQGIQCALLSQNQPRNTVNTKKVFTAYCLQMWPTWRSRSATCLLWSKESSTKGTSRAVQGFHRHSESTGAISRRTDSIILTITSEM